MLLLTPLHKHIHIHQIINNQQKHMYNLIIKKLMYKALLNKILVINHIL